MKNLIFRCSLGLAIFVTTFSTWAGTPDDVYIGLRIDQITAINQKTKNFTAVATLRIDWKVPELAFDPEPGESDSRTYTLPSILKLLQQKNIRWPALSFTNQQGKTAVESQIAQLNRDGLINYIERFTATFQAPDFDFKQFPLDHQTFYISIDSIFPKDEIEFKHLSAFSGLGDNLGQEEWIITDVNSRITDQGQAGFDQGSRFILEFKAKRHINYYVLKIFIPILLIISVAWVTFFLQDYAKRIDLAGGNLLLFIAFNFTISNELPRLGYLTLIDAVMVGTFIITSLVVLVNVILRRLENNDRLELARKLDVYAIAGYPLAYVVGAITLYILFA